MLSWDQDAELNVQVLANTHSTEETREVTRKNPGKQTTYRSPKGNEKQIDYNIIKSRHLQYNKDAAANDMIHMGSDHRCVMATFMITTLKKDGHRKIKKDKARDNKHDRRDQTEKILGLRSLSSKKDTTRSLKKIKKKLKPQTKN